MPGIPELLLILLIVLLVFGAGKLPQIGDALGRSIKNFKRASSGKNEVSVGPKAKEIHAEETPAVSEELPAATKEASTSGLKKDEKA